MLEEFSRRFLAARDKGLSPHESWRKKYEPELLDSFIELCFMRPLEYLEWCDWEEILIYAARADKPRASLEFRYACSLDEATQLMYTYQVAFLGPLIKEGLIGGGSGYLMSRHHPYPSAHGTVNLSLYGRKDIPREHQNFISAEEMHKRLEAFGCRQADPPFKNN